ncbi:MAG: TonB-dependent receptor, partial [Leptospiraceae bacterium]|nr:TonB-dependent receptor [Leptospiraceae bacterium]
EGNYLPLQPLHEFHASIDMLFQHWFIGGEAIFIGAVFKDRTNELAGYEEARWLYNLHASYSVFGKDAKQSELLFTLELKNIMNDRVSDVVGYPLPGRSIYATVSYRF